jgi:hypothetical protein
LGNECGGIRHLEFTSLYQAIEAILKKHNLSVAPSPSVRGSSAWPGCAFSCQSRIQWRFQTGLPVPHFIATFNFGIAWADA